MLRTLATSDRHFWKQSTGEQISQTVKDQYADYDERVLPENEVTSLALNEIAAQHGSGFFFHWPSRSTWTTNAGSARLPPARVPLAPGHQYPTMGFMRCRWNDRMRDSFRADSHRARYLRSSMIMNPPHDETPVFGIQYVFQKCPIFITTPPSLVLFAVKSAYYLTDTATLFGILGRDSKDDRKLGSANWLWDRAALDKGKDDRRDKDAKMMRFKIDTLEQVYHEVLRLTSFAIIETFTAQSVRSIVPRPDPQAPHVGHPLGSRESANPASRRGEKHKFAERKKRKMVADATQED